jgi:hypothetical protein
MAGFGFSPSDIVLFAQFTARVISALKEEGGSKTEYQHAVWCCEGLAVVLNEIKSLDFRHVPDNFLQQLRQCSSDAENFARDFRKTIYRYEKSLGQQSNHGRLRSAPKRVQWALMAADDLDKFRQSLAAKLDLVKVLIQASIL